MTILAQDRTVLRLGRLTSRTFGIDPAAAKGTSLLRWFAFGQPGKITTSMLNPDFDIVGETMHTLVEGDTVARGVHGGLIKVRVHAVTYSVITHNEPDVLLAYPAHIGMDVGRPARVRTLLTRNDFE